MITTNARQGYRRPAHYEGAVEEFLKTRSTEVLGYLAAAGSFSLEETQRDAWVAEISVLQRELQGLEGHLYLEFDVPRLGSRIDAVLVSGCAVFPIEFKVGENRYPPAAINQVWDYALDLKNFHEGSHAAPILPILVATEAPKRLPNWPPPHPDGVYRPALTNAEGLGAVIRAGLQVAKGPALDPEAWGRAPYHPSPTIIEAAQALYAQHSVESISRSDAGARNLRVTSARVEDVIDRARAQGTKAVVFVTGVPGAGKTLVGLNIATQRRDPSAPTHAVFLSGNGPLVRVLQEALAQDELQRRRKAGQASRIGETRQMVKPFIQNVHHFRDDSLKSDAPPIDRVVIFDEAQRAWDAIKTADFMKRKKNLPGFDRSEADLLLSYLDRHKGWAVVVCLVGGGQEIHTGEAGIGAWLDAVRERYAHWEVYVSPTLADSEYRAEGTIAALSERVKVTADPDLHLSVSMRSFRSERVSAFVKAILDLDAAAAREALHEVSKRYPIVISRDLASAKAWVRQQARGSERYGLVSSSNAYRLKPHAIDVRHQVDPVHWFLHDAEDTRSSYYLEDAATEFQIQGLELDWICMTWDADLRIAGGEWVYQEFKGRKWQFVRKPERRQYLLNAYRVLLTRARQGMAIFVPQGDETDPTRAPAYYDETFKYLSSLGLRTV